MRWLIPLALLFLAPACSEDADAADSANAAPETVPDTVQLAAAAAPAAPAPVGVPPGWRQEPAMRGVQYVGRIPADGGGLHVEGWRNDGGFYISDELHAVSAYSSEGRIAFSAEAFRHREADGVAAWTIADFWSYPADRDEAGLGLLCGHGPDPARWSGDDTRHVVAIVRWSEVPRDVETHHEGIVAAAEADLTRGALTPVAIGDVYCHQELG